MNFKKFQQQQQQQLSLLSQASRGRLDMKPKGTINIKTRRRSHGSGTLMASLQAPLSKAKSLELFQKISSRFFIFYLLNDFLCVYQK
jgi:hypothetical protein